jgi:hypothetical protein
MIFHLHGVRTLCALTSAQNQDAQRCTPGKIYRSGGFNRFLLRNQAIKIVTTKNVLNLIKKFLG